MYAMLTDDHGQYRHKLPQSMKEVKILKIRILSHEQRVSGGPFCGEEAYKTCMGYSLG